MSVGSSELITAEPWCYHGENYTSRNKAAKPFDVPNVDILFLGVGIWVARTHLCDP